MESTLATCSKILYKNSQRLFLYKKIIVFLLSMQFAQNLSAQLLFSIDSFTPKSGPAGTSVTISGKGFPKSPSLSVYFGTSKSKVTQVTDSSIVAIVPVSATFAPISLSYFGTVVYSAS